MTLNQLRILREVARHGCNISSAATALNSSQPGLSKQLRLLEQELGIDILLRHGARIAGLSPAGQAILAAANRILDDAESLRRIADDHRAPETGSLTLAATHTQARYALRDAVREFTRVYPSIHLRLRQGTPVEVARMVAAQEADLSFGTEPVEPVPGILLLRCRSLPRIVLAPAGHEILKLKNLTIDRLAEYPLITYDHSFSARHAVEDAFRSAGLVPNVVISGIDADVIKTYVQAGLGLAIVPQIAFEPAHDRGLRALNADHLFTPCTAVIGIHERNYVRSFVYDFVAAFEPRWSRDAVRLERATHASRPRPRP
jgi:LysR family cys regulon transcriptional activator